MATFEVRPNINGSVSWDDKAKDLDAYIQALEPATRALLADVLGDMLELGTWKHIAQAGLAKYATPKAEPAKVEPAKAEDKSAFDTILAELQRLNNRIDAIESPAKGKTTTRNTRDAIQSAHAKR